MASTSTGVNGASRIEERLVCKQLIATNYVKGPGWKRFTPTLSNGALSAAANTGQVWKYRISDGNLEIKGAFSQVAAGTLGAGTYTFTFPSGCTLAAPLVGSGVVALSSGTSIFHGYVIPLTTTTFALQYLDGTNATDATRLTQAWSASSTPSTLRLDSTAVSLILSASFELDPASTILAGTQ